MYNILIIADSAVIDGGSHKVAIDTALLLSRKGHQVTYFAGGYESDSRLKENGIQVVLTGAEQVHDGKPSFRKAANTIWSTKSSILLEDLLQHSNGNTIVHVHSWGSCLSSSVLNVLSKRNIPLVITAHDYLMCCPNSCIYNYHTRKLCDKSPGSLSCLLDNCDKSNFAVKCFRDVRFIAQSMQLKKIDPYIFFISDSQKELMTDSLRFSFSGETINNPIDVELSRPKPNPAFKSLLFVGRLEYVKGVDLFCQAVSALGLDGTVVGNGTMLDALADEYPNINFVGWKSADDVHSYMRDSSVLVFPSRWNEPYGLVPIEALLTGGIPVITSDTSAVSNEIRRYKTGELFESDNLNSLIVAIQKLKNNYRSYIDRLFGIQGRIAEDHSSNMYYKKLVDGYSHAKERFLNLQGQC